MAAEVASNSCLPDFPQLVRAASGSKHGGAQPSLDAAACSTPKCVVFFVLALNDELVTSALQISLEARQGFISLSGVSHCSKDIYLLCVIFCYRSIAFALSDFLSLSQTLAHIPTLSPLQ